MAMNKARRTANLNNILTYDTLGNSTLIANLTVEGLTGAGFVKADAAGLLSVDTAAYTVVTGATNYLTKITAPNTLGQSLVYDNGTSVLVNTAVGVPGYSHAFQVMANGAGGLVVSTTDVASAIGIVNSSSANKTWDISPYGNHLVINESGVATRMKFDAGGNITIGDITNTGHKLEVVGSFRTTGTNTLSALQGVGDRMVVANTNGVLTTQPIPTGSITGTGAAGQVNFWTGTTTVSGSNNLTFSPTPSAASGLGVSLNLSPTLTATANNDVLTAIDLQPTFTNGAFTGVTNYAIRATGQVLIRRVGGNPTEGFSMQYVLDNTLGGTYASKFFSLAPGVAYRDLFFVSRATLFQIEGFRNTLLISNNGNVVVNSLTDASTAHKLQVYGDTLLRGSGNTSVTTALTVQNSSSTNLFTVRNDGLATMVDAKVFKSASPTIQFQDQTGLNNLYNNAEFGIWASDSRTFLINSWGKVGLSISSHNFSNTGNSTVTINSVGLNGFISTNGGHSLVVPLASSVQRAITIVRPDNTLNTNTHDAIRLSSSTYGTYTFFRVDDIGNLYTRGSIVLGNESTAVGTWASIAAGTTTRSQINLAAGVDPTTPTDGDIWATSTDIKGRVAGTTYSLINSGLSGSGTAGQVTFWSSASGLTGSNNLFWDNTNSRLGIGTAPATTLDVTATNPSTTAILTHIATVGNSSTKEVLRLSAYPTTFPPANGFGVAQSFYSVLAQAANSVGEVGRFDISVVVGTPTSVASRRFDFKIKGNVNTDPLYNAFSFITSTTAGVGRFEIPTSNLIVGSTGDGGQRLQVIGDARIFLGSNTGANPNLLVETTNGDSSVLRVQNSEGSFALTANNGIGNVTDGTTAISMQSGIAGIRIGSGSGGFGSGNSMLYVTGSKTSSSLAGRGIFTDATLVASANNDVLVGVDISPTFTNGAFTGVTNYAIRTSGNTLLRGTTNSSGNALTVQQSSGTVIFNVRDDGFVSVPNGSFFAGSGPNGFTISSTSITNNILNIQNDRLQLRVNAGPAYVYNSGDSPSASLVLMGGRDGANANFAPVIIGSGLNASLSRETMRVDNQSQTVLIGSTTSDNINKLQVTGTIVAGSTTSTAGSVILRGSYTAGYLTILGTDASSGGPMLSYGIESAQNSTAGAFVSSSAIAIPRSAYVQNGGHIWYTAPSSSTAIGTAVVPTKHMELYNSGNLVLGGGADDAVNRLQVGGNAFIKGTGNTSATTALTVQNSDSTNLFRVRNDGSSVFINNTGNNFTRGDAAIVIQRVGGSPEVGIGITSDNILRFKGETAGFNFLSGTSQLLIAGNRIYAFNNSGTVINSNITNTASLNDGSLIVGNTVNYVNIAHIYSAQTINPTITGLAGGVARGLYVNPTLTAAADWRSIEWSNNTGWGLYGVGTAKNYLNGTTLIGTTTDDGINKLQVAGSIASAGIVRSDAARTAATNDVSIALLGSNITTYTAGFTMGAAGYGLNAVYAQHEQRFGGNATFDAGNLNGAGLMLNRLAPTAAGTITMNQQAGRIRTMSNLHLQTQIQGNNNITVTHMSGLHIYGHYRTTGTITLTVGDYYGVLLADPNEFSTGPTITGTNWGFYQQGAAPNNHFGGKVLIGTTTVGTSPLRISGLPTSAAGLGAGEIWNNGGVLTVV